MTINYQAVGSGPGVKLLIDENVDFGASDAAMTSEQIAKVGAACSVFPSRRAASCWLTISPVSRI